MIDFVDWRILFCTVGLRLACAHAYISLELPLESTCVHVICTKLFTVQRTMAAGSGDKRSSWSSCRFFRVFSQWSSPGVRAFRAVWQRQAGSSAAAIYHIGWQCPFLWASDSKYLCEVTKIKGTEGILCAEDVTGYGSMNEFLVENNFRMKDIALIFGCPPLPYYRDEKQLHITGESYS